MQSKICLMIIGLVAMTLICSCAYNTAPNGWLPSAGELQKLSFGSWITIVQKDGESKKSNSGELIAVMPDSIFIMADTEWTIIARPEIISAKITSYGSNAGALGLWGVAGMLTTPSQGWFLIVTAPVWLLTTITSGVSQSYVPQYTFPKHNWDELCKFARFPQGLPPGFDRGSLNPKWTMEQWKAHHFLDRQLEP